VKNHPTTLFKVKEKGLNFVHQKCIEFLEEQALAQPKCYSAMNARYSNCSCLNVFDRHNNETLPLTNAVAKYMLYFMELTAVQQRATIVDWLKYTKYATPNEQNAHCTFIMPTVCNCLDEDDIDDVEDVDMIDGNILMPPRICGGAIQTILGIGRHTWQLCKALSKRKKKETPHALIGKASNHAKCFNNDIADDLHLFLSEISKLASPTATQFMQEQTGVLGVCNDDINKLYLEPWYSKHHLFDHFCWECSWKLLTTAKGTVLSRSKQIMLGGTRYNRMCAPGQHFGNIGRNTTHTCRFGHH